MDKFIVSARKYRPQIFETVVGQAHITTTLKNAIRNNQLAHAFLFCGPRGVGKTTCARILAKTINCENVGADGEACNQCHSCTSFNEGTSMNIHELDAASNNSVDDIRSLVEQVRFAPQAGKYKVYIIDEVHMLSTSAFNAFLKTLEEPPPYAIFILATTEKHKILPTILSRCQIFDFKRITLSDTVEHLASICKNEQVNADTPALQLIAQKSEGCMRDALSIMDKIVSFTGGKLTYNNTLEHLNILDEDYYFKLLSALQTENLPDALLLFDEINKKGFEGDSVLNGLSEFFRNLLVCKDERAAVLLEAIDSFRDKYISTAANTSASWLVSALNVLNDAEIGYKQARNKKLHIELVLIKLCYLHQAIELAASSGGVVSKKKQVSGPVVYKIKPVKNPSISVPPPATSGGAKLVVETPVQAEMPPPPAYTPAPPPEPAKPKMLQSKTLKELRQKAAENKTAAKTLPPIPLTKEVLEQIWLHTGRELNKDGRSASVQSVFDLAVLNLVNETSFDVEVGSNVHMRVIDQYRTTVMEKLQAHFNRKDISFNISIRESLNEINHIPQPPGAKEQFVQLSEQYPLVKELKDKLGLELDY
ncbi:MAG: DNA polymerase III subunit gamma/tau [Dinghuibacter sp.]|nr:DNA polymerase III subunit gamma/tau [Dinghuibacter sp.]